MFISEIIYGLYVNKDMFVKHIITKELHEDYCNIEVFKMHNFYFFDKGYERLRDYLKDSKDCGIIVKVIKTPFDNSYVELSKIPHAVSDLNNKRQWQNEQ